MDELAIWLGMDPDLVRFLRLDLLGRLLLAAALGGLIGLERELADKPAGLRTNLLICVGAALLVEVSIAVSGLAEGAPSAGTTTVVGDPARIAAQIVSGIGFLGAGTIIQARGSVTGLTTAATIWVVAAIGMAVGARAYVEAIGGAILVGLSLVLLARVEVGMLRRYRTRRYTLELAAVPDLVEEVEKLFRQHGMRIETEVFSKSDAGFELSYEASGPAGKHYKLSRALIAMEGVRKMTRVA